MPLVRLGLNVNGDQQISRALHMTAREAEDLSDPLREFGHYLLREIGEQFATEGEQGGTPWQQLSTAYQAWKDEHYPGRPILVRDGVMRAEALSPNAVRVQPHRLDYELDQAAGESYREPGDTVDRGQIALIHQQGKGPQPARPIAMLNQQARRQLDRTFADWLNGVRRGAFGTAA